MFCIAKHRPTGILKCGKDIATILMKTQATSSTSKLHVLPLEPAINTGCQPRSSDCHKKMEVFKGCCLKHQIWPILHFFWSFFHPSQIRLPLWQYESRIMH